MNSGDSGSFTRLKDDMCARQKDTYQSTEHGRYAFYPGKFENRGKCTYDDNSFYRPFDPKIIDAESELLGITRPASSCPQYKYSPTCEKSKSCTKTRDSSVPIVLAQEVCPIVKNNIPRMTNSGLGPVSGPSCKN